MISDRFELRGVARLVYRDSVTLDEQIITKFIDLVLETLLWSQQSEDQFVLLKEQQIIVKRDSKDGTVCVLYEYSCWKLFSVRYWQIFE